MPYTSRFNEEINAIETVYSGTLTINDLHENLKKTMDLSHKHRVTRFLADCTGMSPGGSVLNIYEFAKQLENIPEVYRLKEAIILPVLPDSAKDLTFFETTARNRGLNVRIFGNREDAITWLSK
ncbi:MAG: hypothetical protein HGB19_01100 [Chlorobiales bacterium]|jgi:hypothetical protein|nr:hypothetical protein [Chlorobiales bacterium]